MTGVLVTAGAFYAAFVVLTAGLLGLGLMVLAALEGRAVRPASPYSPAQHVRPEDGSAATDDGRARAAGLPVEPETAP